MVVVFHATLPLPGGYTGVDVFFVISGFVITRLLVVLHQATSSLKPELIVMTMGLG
jgi:peptidoglycan/LPS O-acetylase OafA/YrhL